MIFHPRVGRGQTILKTIAEHAKPVQVIERDELLRLVGGEKTMHRALNQLVYSGEVVVYLGTPQGVSRNAPEVR